MSAILPVEILSRFAPDPDRLLDHLRAQVDDEMLREMAMLDCGSYNEAPQFAALKQLRDTGLIPVPLLWEPKESLQLTTYLEPGTDGDPSAAVVRHEHQIRAFACSAILRAHVEPENRFIDIAGILARLVSSAQFLGAEVEDHLAAFLAWRVTQLAKHDRRPFFAYALLLPGLVSRRAQFNAVEISCLCDWVLAEQGAERQYYESHARTKNWERGLSFPSVRGKTWRVLSLKLKEHSAGIGDPGLSGRLAEMADVVLGPRDFR